MKLTSLQPVYAAQPPVTSVFLDVSRTAADAAHRIGLRWRAVEERLDAEGASPDVIAAIKRRVQGATGFGGVLSRTVVASATADIVADELHDSTGRRDHGHVGLLPHLMPTARARCAQTPYLLVKVDHVGADIVCVEGSGLDPQTLVSEGGHDVVHKVPGGGWSHRRYQSRVEDSWDRNAAQVASDLDSVVSKHRPEAVFLVGEAYSRSAVRKEASGNVLERLIELEHGTRADGGSDQSMDDEIAQALAQLRLDRVQHQLEIFGERAGQDHAVADGFDAVVDALRAGSVETLLLVDDPSSTLTLVAGEQPLQLGRSEDEVSALGATRHESDRADEVMLRALVALDAELVLVDREADLEVEIKDGVGALLRFDTRPQPATR